MTEAEALTLQLLRQIDRKLEQLLKEISGPHAHSVEQAAGDKSYSLLAREIAELTPRSVQQSDSVELLREDRSR
jgi:hypothetical protein